MDKYLANEVGGRVSNYIDQCHGNITFSVWLTRQPNYSILLSAHYINVMFMLRKQTLAGICLNCMGTLPTIPDSSQLKEFSTELQDGLQNDGYCNCHAF